VIVMNQKPIVIDLGLGEFCDRDLGALVRICESCKPQAPVLAQRSTGSPYRAKAQFPFCCFTRARCGTGGSNPPLSATQSGMFPYIMEKR
jgi:hypothetical protein